MIFEIPWPLMNIVQSRVGVSSFAELLLLELLRVISALRTRGYTKYDLMIVGAYTNLKVRYQYQYLRDTVVTWCRAVHRWPQHRAKMRYLDFRSQYILSLSRFHARPSYPVVIPVPPKLGFSRNAENCCYRNRQ
jgi:hypothetical protein